MSRRLTSDAVYVDRVDALTEAAIAEGSASFAALLRRLPAVYPTEVLASLDRLVTAGLVEERVAQEARREASRSACRRSARDRARKPIFKPPFGSVIGSAWTW